MEILIDINELTFEIMYNCSIYRDEGTCDTPPYHEWEYEIETITVHGEYGDGQEVLLSDLSEEVQHEINEHIDDQIISELL
jgi:hypothetical protein